jgi:hypothetical protein
MIKSLTDKVTEAVFMGYRHPAGTLAEIEKQTGVKLH